MLTFLTSPKPFRGEAVRNQLNAIRSWRLAVPSAEVRLYGDADGIGELVDQTRAVWVKDIETTTTGTPVFGAIASDAAKNGRFDIQVYVNCDILLFPGFHRAVSLLRWPRFLVVGQRIDLAAGVDVSEVASAPLRNLRELGQTGKAALHPAAGSDYFVFRRGQWTGIPPVAIGRAGYDNVLIAFCLTRGIPVVDATYAVLAVHQYHEYGHLAGGVDEVFSGAEARENILRLGGIPPVTSTDAGWRLTEERPLRSACRGDWARAFYLWIARKPAAGALVPAVVAFRKLLARTTFSRAVHPTLGEVLAAVEEFETVHV